MTDDYEAHGGTVSLGTTPRVQMAFAGSSASNYSRPFALVYPNDRNTTISYGATGGVNDRLNRPMRLNRFAPGPVETYVEYDYLGLGRVVQIDYKAAKLRWKLYDGSDPTDLTDLDECGRIWAFLSAGIIPQSSVQGNPERSTPSCTTLIAEFETYRWHPDKPDVPLDRSNHCCDALRYGVTAIDPQFGMPVEVRVIGADVEEGWMRCGEDEWWHD